MSAEELLEWEEECADMDIELDDCYERYQERVREPFLHDLFLKHALTGLHEDDKEYMEGFLREEKELRREVFDD